MILHQLLIHSISFGHSLILELFQGTQTAQGLTIRHLNLLGGVPPPHKSSHIAQRECLLQIPQILMINTKYVFYISANIDSDRVDNFHARFLILILIVLKKHFISKPI